ncbi:MAG TPA: nuclear transport factor 2 family protein [Methylomirabilota bacterium]|nr:nuclear transport factor 2 family protein [Methylomirabilota bacterium]
MRYRQTLFTVAVVVVLVAPLVARSDDLTDLKAAFEQGSKAANARDLEAFAATWHDQVVSFGSRSPFPVDGKPALRQSFQTVFANHESFSFTPINPQYRVSSNLGVAWGNYMLALKPKDGPLATSFGRYAVTFVKSDGQWLQMVRHFSLLPPEN